MLLGGLLMDSKSGFSVLITSLQWFAEKHPHLNIWGHNGWIKIFEEQAYCMWHLVTHFPKEMHIFNFVDTTSIE